MSQENLYSFNHLGLYIHVPFCASTCDFCAFYQESPDRRKIEQYLEGMEREMVLRPLNRKIRTIFVGGGTPGVLTVKDWEHLGGLIRQYCGTSSPVEWTVEMAPSTIHPDKLALFRELGVTRISVGIQSFQEETLHTLGRRQPLSRIVKSLHAIQEARFPTWSMDLMFALPGQNWASWQADMEAAFEWAPSHLSTYCLTLEEDTPLYVRTLKSGNAPTEEEQAEFYLRTWDFMGEHGYPQYEISNFAPKSHHCIHNIDTWSMQEWIGLGPSAASQYQHRRWQNIPDNEQWLQQLSQGKLAEIEVSTLTQEDLAVDSLIFGLRMNEGIDLHAWTHRFGRENTLSLLEILQKYREQEWLFQSETHLKLTDEGRLLADSIASSILDEWLPS